MFTMYHKHHHSSLAVGLVPLLLRLGIVTERASNDQHLGRLDDTMFVAKLSRVRK